jgi:hypothetical protein
MAKLSAHGKELQRYEKHTAADPVSGTVIRVTRVVMEDRYILEKTDWQYFPEKWRSHGTGWQRRAKLKEGYDPVVLQEYWEARGFERQT